MDVKSITKDRRQHSVPIQNELRSGVDRRVKNRESVFCALEIIPSARRTYSVSEKIDKKDYLGIAGILGYTLVNLKEDIRDTVSAAKQIYSKINPNYKYDPLYDRKNYQHSFSATRGMVGEKWLHERIKNQNPFAQKIYELDKTIDSTSFGEWIINKFKILECDSIKIEQIKNYKGRFARAYLFDSKIFGGKTIARAMKRTTLLGVVIIGLLELPKIAKEISNGKTFSKRTEKGSKQIFNSACSVILSTAGIAVLGALGAQYLGATGSLIGMGLGAIISNKASNKIQEIIN